ncbi:MAG: hemerythrin family protein [Georgfuchsia sp.]
MNKHNDLIENCNNVSMTDFRPVQKIPTEGLDPSAPRDSRPQLQYAEWSDLLELGIPEIDEQHKRFFDLAESLNGNGDEVRVMKTLAMLSDYIRQHLRDEEAMMAATRYPGLKAHCRLHADFRRMLGDLLGRARKMSLDEIAEEVKYLVNGWFYQHIVTADSEYAPYVMPDHPSHSHTSTG